MNQLALLALALAATPALAQKHTVIYELPVPVELEAFSRYEITYETELLASGATQLKYTLPATLLGHEQEIVLEGETKSGAFELKGENADMACVSNAESALCRVVHHNIKFDLNGVVDALALSDFSPAQRQGKLALAAFVDHESGGNMVGVMSYVQGLKPRY